MTTTANRIPLFALLGGTAVSLVGNALANLAIPWYVLQSTGSAALTGVSAFFGTLPLVLSALLGGTMVDRLGYRRAIIISDVASGIAVALIPLLGLLGVLEYPYLLALVFAGALLDPPGNAARQAILPDLAARGDVRLERANAAYTTVQQAALLIGAPVAGILIAAAGSEAALWVDVATFAGSAMLVTAFVPTATPVKGDAEELPLHRPTLLAGLHFVLREPLVRALVLTGTAVNFLTPPLLGVVIPVYVRQTFGNAVNLGLLLATFSAGSVVAGLAYTAIAPRLPRRPLLLLARVAEAAGVATLAARPPFGGMLLAMAFIGVASGTGPAVAGAPLLERIPEHIRGSAFSAIIALALAATPLGMLLGGLALELIGTSATLLALTAGYALIALILLLSQALRGMDTMPAAGGPEPPHVRSS